MDALFELSAETEKNLKLRRGCQVALLRKRLDSAGAPHGALAPIDWLKTLSLADLTRLGSPFFWRSVVCCHVPYRHASPELGTAVRYLLMTGFDAFFDAAPDGTAWALPPGDDPLIVLPRLGVRLAASAGPVSLVRAGTKLLQVHSDAGTNSIPLDDIPSGARLDWLPVASDGSARLLLGAHPALFPSGRVANLSADSPEAVGHAAMIVDTLDMIRKVDPRLAAQIEARIRWYVHLVAPSLDKRKSHTFGDLPGVIFQSPGRAPWVLSESIIHEFCHNVLNARMEVETLLAVSKEWRCYSPWREDPRPLSGLLHAVFVFTGVAEFFLCLENDSRFAELRSAVRDRRRLVVEQLRLGHAQASPEMFTARGWELFEGLRQIIERHDRELELPRDRLPKALADHLQTWCEANPHLAASVRTVPCHV